MKTMNISLGVVVLILTFITPQVSQAYFTTAQNAVKINPTTALFTIEYVFGHDDYDLYMPILAERGLMWKGDANKVGYTFRQDDEEVLLGRAAGMVLSNAPIVNGMYKIEKGTAKKLLFFVLLSTQTDTPEMDYALQVENLPFKMDDKGTLEQLQLNPSELQYYVTKEVN